MSPDARPAPRQGVLRRGKTVFRRAVSGATNARRASSVADDVASAPSQVPVAPPPARAPPGVPRPPLEPLPLSQPVDHSRDPSISHAPPDKLDRRVSAPPLPLPRAATHTAASTRPDPDPALEEEPRPDPNALARVSRTGLVERSVAAAVISAARNRANTKKNRTASPAKPPHHRPHGGFINPWASALRDVGLRARGGHGSRTFFHKVAKDRRPPDEQLATMLLLAARPDFEEAAEAVQRDKYALASTWIGHSTFVLQMNGLTVLTDPVWSPRLGPLGPKRLVPPPCDLDDLPSRIDVVLISSACYDHFDKHAVAALATRVSTWLVPLGLKPMLLALGLKDECVVELDWWDEHCAHGATFVCTPAQHCSIRDDVLWSSWVIGATNHRAFFCGATGYRAVNRDAEDRESFEARSRFGGPTCPVFKEISRRYGTFDTALLPIGGFKPRVTMSGVQGDAIDMLFVHRDLRARRSIAHRWGTFACMDEGMLDAVRVLELGLQTAPVPEHEFVYVKHGRLHLT